MTPELLLLSTRVALLVLAASALAFVIGWRLRGSRAPAALEQHSLVPVSGAPQAQASADLPTHTEVEPLKAALASAEQQCLDALEQRDEAERVAHERAREVRRLTEELEALRAEHLALAQTQAVALPTVANTSPAEAPAASLTLTAEDLQPARSLAETLAADLQALEDQLASLTAEHDHARSGLVIVSEATPVDKAALKAATKQSKDTERRLAQATEGLARKRRQLRAVTRSLAAAAEGLTADDLTRIKGIKTILNAQLHDHGIFSYQQIAQWDAEDMLAFGELLAFKNRIVKDGWQEQARALHQAAHPGSPEL
jgi:predicted flap endonuclease-1-like 5' DNA nuclease